jgi:hypothetical protein
MRKEVVTLNSLQIHGDVDPPVRVPAEADLESSRN